MNEDHAGPPGSDRVGIEKEQNGSPRIESCANTGSGRTAGKSSACGEIKPTDPVPLYLVPAAIAGEIRRLGGVISEVHVRRTGRHCYAIAVSTRGEGA
ncbi:MAG: hypothetical protein PWP08_1873 [Methanofollis sp.]|nr:hypothetical protein [Methanofollis sp.]